MVYNRTRFIVDDKVVYQRVRREMRLASDNSWARRRLKHVSWRSRLIIFFCIHLNREWQFHAKFNELTDAFFACPPDWAQGPPQLRDKPRSTAAWLWDNCSRLVGFLQQTVDVSRFPTLVNALCTTLLWQIEIFNQNHVFLWNFHDFVYFLLLCSILCFIGNIVIIISYHGRPARWIIPFWQPAYPLHLYTHVYFSYGK